MKKFYAGVVVGLLALGLFASAAYLGVPVWLRLWWPLVFLPVPAYLVARPSSATPSGPSWATGR